MNIIPITATLIAAPVPPDPPSTRITVRVAAGDTMTLASLALAADHPFVTVAWGDGETTFAPGGKFTHAYAAAGEYEISISDDIGSLVVVGKDDEAIASAPLVVGFATDAHLLTQLSGRSFEGCVNLANPILDKARIDKIFPGAFGLCLSFTGVLRLPSVTAFPGPHSQAVRAALRRYTLPRPAKSRFGRAEHTRTTRHLVQARRY